MSSNYHERTARRADYRNGCYRRKQGVTPAWTLNQVRVPRCRHRGFCALIEGYITRGLEQLTPRRGADPYPDALRRLERVFREVRKRTRPIGCFVNDASISRGIYATLMHYNTQQRKRHKKKRSQQAVV